jgi:hypothetical protein
MMRMSARLMVGIFAASVGGSLVHAAEPIARTQELVDDWKRLFDGESLSGWQAVGEARWQIVDGTIRTAGDKPGFLMTDAEYGDFELQVEFKAPAGTNSGVFLRSVVEPTDPTKDCVELNIAPPDNPFPTGSLVGRRKTVRRAAEMATPDDWHTLFVEFDGHGCEVAVDGKYVLKYVGPASPRRGHIGLQSNSGEVAFRNIRLRVLRGE